MSRHEPRQRLALEFGATDIVEERGDEGVARIKDLTDGLGAHSVIEAVGTQESMMQAIRSTRPGGHMGYVGVAYGVELSGEELFFSHVHLHGGPSPVRRFLPQLVDLIWNREIERRGSSPGEALNNGARSSGTDEEEREGERWSEQSPGARETEGHDDHLPGLRDLPIGSSRQAGPNGEAHHLHRSLRS